MLPSEAELSAEFDASRVTIRKALDMLRTDGLVDSRQGFGWLVAAKPVQQSLEQLGTLDDQFADFAATSERDVLGFGFVKPPPWVAATLGEGAVLEVQRRNVSNGLALARVTVWCGEALGADLSRADVESATFHQLLPVTLGGATQTIAAQAVSPADASLLDIPVGSPVLVVHRITNDAEGHPVLVSEHVFPAHLTEFFVELSAPSASLNPHGLRLVEGAAATDGS